MNEYRGYKIRLDSKTPRCFVVRVNSNKRPLIDSLRGSFTKINEAKRAIDTYEDKRSRRRGRKVNGNQTESVATV